MVSFQLIVQNREVTCRFLVWFLPSRVCFWFDDSPLRAGERVPLALSGRVPVKLQPKTVQLGVVIHLCSSLPGVAMKATGTGATIGIVSGDF